MSSAADTVAQAPIECRGCHLAITWNGSRWVDVLGARHGLRMAGFCSASTDPDPVHVPGRGTAKVILFKPSGKYYTEERWEIPTYDETLERGGNGGDSAIPYCMRFSKDFRQIDGGPALVITQEPWGYPHLIQGT